ncbi:MAG: DUF721 domain-containing protein [Waddliaceae bacterium]
MFEKRLMRKTRDGTKVTTKKLKDLLPKTLAEIRKQSQVPTEQIQAYWPEIVGDKISQMSSVEKYSEGVLSIKVQNATLLSLLSQYEKHKILKQYRKYFPNVSFADARFRLG